MEPILLPKIALTSTLGSVAAVIATLSKGPITPGVIDEVLSWQIIRSLSSAVVRFRSTSNDESRWPRQFIHSPTPLERLRYTSSPGLFVYDECDRLLAIRPDDDVIRWYLIAEDIIVGHHGFIDRFVPLVLRDIEQLPWLIGASLWYVHSSGAELTLPLRDVLGRIDSASVDHVPRMRRLRDSKDSYASSMIVIADEILHGAMLSDEKYRVPRTLAALENC